MSDCYNRQRNSEAAFAFWRLPTPASLQDIRQGLGRAWRLMLASQSDQALTVVEAIERQLHNLSAPPATTHDSHTPLREFVYCTGDVEGSRTYVRASGKPVFDASGEFGGYRGTDTDVTAIVRAQRAEESLQTVQAELARVSRVTTLGQLTASIAHEITQPIASARNNARAALNFLDKQPPDLAESREALTCVVADTDRAGQIVDRIRDQIKKAPPRRDCFDLNGAVTEVIALVQGEITSNRVSVQTRLTGGECLVEGDRVQLQQVVMNLILNAIEAMSSVESAARELLISTEQNEANGVLAAVRDSGPGIDPERLERVFEPFYTTKRSGMGMGLSICRSIIDAHGGRLWANAMEPSGTVFQFTVPTVERELMDSDPERHPSEEPHAGIASADSRRRVSEDNRRRHLSRRGPDQHHLDSQ
jgi:C4-dicarboxylate-specific signal transduction histidine kinase